MGDIYKKLQTIQSNLKAPKGQRNSFGNYNYRSCEDILEAVKPLLAEQGIVLTLSDSIESVGGWNYVKAKAEIFDSEDTIFVEAFAREEETKKGMDSAQITGAASSYARKYALNGLFAIDDTKDADTHDNTEHATTGKQNKPPTDDEMKYPINGMATDKQKEYVSSLMDKKGISKEAQKAYLVTTLGVPVPLTKDGAQEAINRLKGEIWTP